MKDFIKQLAQDHNSKTSSTRIIAFFLLLGIFGLIYLGYRSNLAATHKFILGSLNALANCLIAVVLAGQGSKAVEGYKLAKKPTEEVLTPVIDTKKPTTSIKNIHIPMETARELETPKVIR